LTKHLQRNSVTANLDAPPSTINKCEFVTTWAAEGASEGFNMKRKLAIALLVLTTSTIAQSDFNTKFEVMTASASPGSDSIPSTCYMVLRDNTHNDLAYGVSWQSIFTKCHYWYPGTIMNGRRGKNEIQLSIIDKNGKSKVEHWKISSVSQLVKK
jgi:hypothetical protein